MSQILQTRIAFLESQIDLLETELSSLNTVLVQCGFPEGIKTLKETVEGLLSNSQEISSEEDFNLF